MRERFVELDEGEQSGFRGALQEYVRKYAFLSQLLTFDDAELERLYLFARYLKRYHFDEMAESNFKLLKRIVDDRQFGAVLVDRLFERFWRVMREGIS